MRTGRPKSALSISAEERAQLLSIVQLLRRTRRKRKWATVRAITRELRRIRHDAIDEQGRRLASMLEGHYAYFAVPTNIDAFRAVRHHVKVRWYLSLRRRSTEVTRHRDRCGAGKDAA